MNDQSICAIIESKIQLAFSSSTSYNPGTPGNPVSHFLVPGSFSSPSQRWLIAQFDVLDESVDVYFDNITAHPLDEGEGATIGEHIMINVVFNKSIEPTLTSALQRARGAIIARVFTRKNVGAGRARVLSSRLKDVLMELACSPSTRPATWVRVFNISGPEPVPDVEENYFMLRLSASWEAAHLTG